MIDEPSPILDYASPRPRRKLRLPAKSVLDVRLDPDRRGITIIEKLDGVPQAIVAMLFALFVLIVVGAVTATHVRTAWVKHHVLDGGAVMLAVFWLIELALLVIVIHETWKRTILEARDGRVILRFSALFTRREHRWPFQEVADLDAVSTQDAVGAFALAELRFRATDDVPVHLFTDHRAEEIEMIQSLLGRVLAGEPLPATPAAATEPAFPELPPPDGKTVSRLVDVRKSIRQRESNLREIRNPNPE